MSTVTRRLVGTMLEPAPEVSGPDEWRYDPADPYAVSIAFDTRDGERVWVFSRDLLAQGLVEPAGLGDVRLWPEGERLMVALDSPAGLALVRYRRRQAKQFLLATYRSVPHGTESMDLDGLAEQLVDGAS